MTSRERLLKTLNGEKVDRIPISLYEFDGAYDSWIRNYPEYVEILKYAEGKTDKMYFWGPSGGDRPFLFYGEIEKENIKTTKSEQGKSIFTKTVIKTPLGEVFSQARQDEGIHTSWVIEKFCKDEEDAKKILSLPYIPWCPPVESFFKVDDEVGGLGIILGDIPDALCLTVELFGFTRFLMMYMDNRDLIFKLMDFFQERIYNYLEHLLEKGAVTLYRICGPEYATPPYLSPKEFDNLVTPYDKELVNLLHQYNALARLHCHGKIKEVLDKFIEMGIDAIDPIEPPPDGDIKLEEVSNILGDKITLIGNIEERLLEIGTKGDIENAVKEAIKDGTKGEGGFILCPTAMPLTTPLDNKIKENIIFYIDMGIKYGDKGTFKSPKARY